jgi:hypothetical protein
MCGRFALTIEDRELLAATGPRQQWPRDRSAAARQINGRAESLEVLVGNEGLASRSVRPADRG